MTGVVYGLSDGNDVRYVGKTTKVPEQRLREHLAKAARQKRLRVSKWLGSLSKPPVLVVLERDPVGGLDAAERAWIATLRDIGCNLTNTTDGGEGGATWRGRSHSPASRAKIAATLSGRKLSPERRAKISAALTGRSLAHATDCRCCVCVRRPHTVETKAKIAVASAGRLHSAEAREKISAAKRGKPRPLEMVARMSASRRGRPWSLARRAAQEQRRERVATDSD